MSKYLVTGGGKRLLAGAGEVLTADAPGDAYSKIVPATMASTIGAIATVSAMLVASVSPMATTFGATADITRNSGVAVAATTFTAFASPSGLAVAGAALASTTFTTEGTPSGLIAAAVNPFTTAFTASASPAFEIQAPVTPAGMAFVFGATATGSRSAIVIPAVAAISFGATANITANLAAKWRSMWLAVYGTRQVVLNAIDANNRFLAQGAATAAGLNASALVVTNSRVGVVEGNLIAESNRVTSLTQTVNDGATATNNQLTYLGGRITTNSDDITLQGNAITSINAALPGKASAAAVDSLSTTVSTLNGTVTSQGNAITSLNSTVGGHTSSLTTLSSTTATLNGNVASLKASHTLALNVDGNISGYTSENDGTTSSFSILATVFKVLGFGSTGMEWKDGYIRIWKGSSQLILGNSFGADGNLVLWYGANIGAASATKANASVWFDNGGDAYFGGSLSAGVLKNAAVSTQISTTASVETGNFGTNGGSKSVIASCNFSNLGYSATDLGAGTTTGTFVVERSIGGGSWSTVATGNMTGNKESLGYEPGLGYRMRIGCTASITYTDSNASTSDFNYRTTVTAASGWPVTLNSPAGAGKQQTTILSVEG